MSLKNIVSGRRRLIDKQGTYYTARRSGRQERGVGDILGLGHGVFFASHERKYKGQLYSAVLVRKNKACLIVKLSIWPVEVLGSPGDQVIVGRAPLLSTPESDHFYTEGVHVERPSALESAGQIREGGGHRKTVGASVRETIERLPLRPSTLRKGLTYVRIQRGLKPAPTFVCACSLSVCLSKTIQICSLPSPIRRGVLYVFFPKGVYIIGGFIRRFDTSLPMPPARYLAGPP